MNVPEHSIYYFEIVTEDVDQTRSLYAGAYGWEFDPAVPELGNAYLATLPDGSLCGIRAPMSDSEQPIVRTYLRVHDIERAVKEAEEMGAFIALPPMAIPGRGTIAIYIVGGIQQVLWQVP